MVSWGQQMLSVRIAKFSSHIFPIEVMQRYQLDHRHDGAEHNEARAEH